MKRPNSIDVLTGKKDFSLIPDSPSGIALGEKRKGFFSVIVPTDETINYVENPSFMAGEHPYDSIGYNGVRGTLHGYTEVNCSGSRATALTPDSYPMWGGWVNIQPSSGEEAGLYYSVELTADQYTFSCFVAGDKGQTFSVYVLDGSDNRITEKKTIKGNGNWQRLHVTFEATSTQTFKLYLIRNRTKLSSPDFYTSFWVCEDNAFLTLPFNGNYREKNTPFNDKGVYTWVQGGEWTSKSKRTEFACNSGKEEFLKDYGFVLNNIIGLGSSGISHITKSVSSFGSVWNTTKIKSREFTLKGVVQAEALEKRMENEHNLDRILSSTNRINPEQPTAILFRVFNDNDNTIIEGQTIYIYCRFNGGIMSNVPNENGNYEVSLSFSLIDPYLYSSMHKGYYLDSKLTYTSDTDYSVFTKDANNDWEKPDIEPDEVIKRIVRGENGKVYFGGYHEDVNGVSNTAYMAEYDEKTDTVKSIGVFADSANSDNFVSDIIALPNGNLIVGGSFASVDSVADTQNIAQYNPATDTWTAIGSGTPTSDLMINSMGADQAGNIYVVGIQDDGTANSVHKIVLSSGTWSTIGTLNSGDDITAAMVEGVKLLVVNRKADPEYSVADIYVAGIFANVNSVEKTFGLARYNGYNEIWESLGDRILTLEYADLYTADDDNLVTATDGDNIVVYKLGGSVQDMALGTDGKIYMVGTFATTESGIVSPHVIRYNGENFESIGLPRNYLNFVIGAKQIEIDNDGGVHVLVDFSFRDYTPLAKTYFVLNGNVWKSGGLYTDGTGTRVISDGALYWDRKASKIWMCVSAENGNVTYGGATNIIQNNGEAVYPNLTFVGNGKLVSIGNRATGKTIDFSAYELQASEIVELDLERHGVEIIKLVSNINGNISRMISLTSNMDFNLVRGRNKVGYILADTDSDASCFAVWRERYIGLYEAINFRKITLPLA